MKKQLIALFLLFSGIYCYSQIKFERGYFINNNGEKTDCYIKNIDWLNSPSKIVYKLSENDKSSIMAIDSISEFHVLNGYKYKKFIVKIDRSSEEYEKLGTTKFPQFEEDQLLLKVLVDGKAKLYSYEDGNLIRYFFQIDSIQTEQLIYKSYKTSMNQVGENNFYRHQLLVNLKCDEIPESYINNIDYKKEDLVKFFNKYNACVDTGYVNSYTKRKLDLWNLTIRPGLNYSSLAIRNFAYSFNPVIDFKDNLSFRIGIESEFLMPFNKNKWAIIIEPSFQYFKSKAEQDGDEFRADYKSIELPVGIRYYVFLNDRSKIFINGSFLVAFSMNSKIYFSYRPALKINRTEYLALGTGYKIDDKYSIELRFGFNREMFPDYVFWISRYRTLSVFFGYTLI